MWGRIYPHVILLIFVNIFKASCEGTSSLTFVIDDTNSMSDDIAGVRRSVDKIMNIVFNEKSSVIKNMVLVTFNDPDSHVRTVTTSRDTFNRALDAVYVHGGGDCPEMAMQGLLLALDNSLPGSYLYVFTDASAKDYLNNSDAVKEMCQTKQSQIVFVLTGYCYGEHEPGYKVYYEIATACAGMVFHVKKHEVDEVLRTIEETIKGKKTVLTTITAPAGVSTDIPFTIDDQTEYAIVSASGSYVSLSISGPWARQQRIMWHNNGKVIKLIDPTPGRYVATVKGQTATSVVIVGRTDFLFSHGFSELEPKTKGDTAPQPIADTNVHLSITVTEPKHAVRIVSAQILQMDEKVIQELTLTETSKDFYITRPFVAPSQMFKVAVQGIIKSTGKLIIRTAKIPVTPQKPPKKLPNNTKPIVNIVEGSSIRVDYNSKVKLTCKVTAYPDPKIKWINSRGVTMNSLSSVVQYPYEFISYLEIPNATQGDKYVCYAVNNQDKDSKSISVNVNDALVAQTVPRGTTKVFYGSEGTIICDIRSPVPMRIHWYFADETTGANEQIITSDKYLISADGTHLKINKMDLNLEGIYTCKASLVKDANVQKSFSTRVRVDGLVTPKVTGAAETKAIKGKNAAIECKIVKGLPTPKITWQYMDKSGSKFVPIAGSDVLRIPSVEDKHGGRYKCVAVNVAGSDEHVTTLTIQEFPKITSSSSSVYQSAEGDALLKIPCVATGLPKPDIVWKLNGGVIKPNAKFSIEDGALIIRDPKIGDTNSYTCEAKNEVASVTATFKAYILQAPKLSGVADKKVRIGEPASIECTVVKGEPKPKITWQYMDKSSSKFTPLAGSDNVLRISIAVNNLAGHYKCVAQNTAGSDEHVTILTVESPPRIITKSGTVFEGLEGDVALRIPCEVVGVPKPAITWKFKGAIITSNDKYAIEDEALVIMKPTTKDSNSSYACEAKNYIGSDTATFDVNVEKDIDNDFGNIHYIYLLEHETKQLKCQAYNGTVSQSVRWFIGGADMNVNKPYMTIEDATVDKDGNYTCRVSDKHGHAETHIYVVDVGFPPRLGEQTTLDNWRGDVDHILSNCRNDAKPEADVEWKFNGKVITEGSLIDARNDFKWGHYSCNISNVHGSVQRSFDVKSSACLISRNLEDDPKVPLLLTDEKSWPEWEYTKHYLIVEQEEKITLSCPNKKGIPNTFQKFPKQSELKAYCDKQDTLLVDGTFYKLSDLHCSNGIYPSIVKKKVKCSTDTSESIRVGYDVSGFLETYEVCFEHAYNMPLYSRVLMTKTADSPSSGHHWFKYPGIGDSKGHRGLTCKDSSALCCYGKSQLVNARDFNNDHAKYTTFIDSLNTIPYWRPCNKEITSWDDIDDMVRIQLNNYDQFVAWSGIHTLQEKDGAIVPRYLWKVLRFDVTESVAIVHVNDQSVTDKDIKCDSKACSIDEEYWFTPSSNATYCCKLPDFLEAFDMRGTDVGELLDAAYGKIKSRT